ncbi:MAG TPA: MarR family transcriptional regulator [Candidatus Paceibacterota bacterium]|nr:MarR family transcriptional regulator [Candidatus Paceibacterota bacterium]
MHEEHLNLKATKIALLQSKFHRITKHRLAAALRPFQLQSVEWIILGLLNHRKKPMAITEIAHEVGVQQSFMTVIVTKLAKRNLITVTEDKVDHRKKYIILTKEGAKIVHLMQRQFMEFFIPLARGLSAKDMDTYLKLVTTIIRNAEGSGVIK